MSYEPINFENLPSKKTPLNAENLNHMQQGIILAVDRSSDAKEIADNLNTLHLSGALKGDKGDKGENGKDGQNFEVDGEVALLDDLPPAELHTGEIWLTNQYGHLHKSNGVEWIDWGQFTGIKGDKGDKGEDGVFDIDAISQSQLQALHGKLTPLNSDQQWKYQVDLQPSKTAKFQIADLNLYLIFVRNAGATMSYKFEPVDTTKPSTYYVNRLSNYDAIAWESSVTAGYTSQAITASGFILDASGYLPGREHTDIEVIDHNSNSWYSIRTIGLNNGLIFVDVVKKAVHGRIMISSS